MTLITSFELPHSDLSIFDNFNDLWELKILSGRFLASISSELYFLNLQLVINKTPVIMES